MHVLDGGIACGFSSAACAQWRRAADRCRTRARSGSGSRRARAVTAYFDGLRRFEEGLAAVEGVHRLAGRAQFQNLVADLHDVGEADLIETFGNANSICVLLSWGSIRSAGRFSLEHFWRRSKRSSKHLRGSWPLRMTSLTARESRNKRPCRRRRRRRCASSASISAWLRMPPATISWREVSERRARAALDGKTAAWCLRYRRECRETRRTRAQERRSPAPV